MESSVNDRLPVLEDDVLYDMYDRWVCGRVGCAGWTASCSGISIDGYRLKPITERDVVDWWAEFQSPVRCQCGVVERAPTSVS